jgi:hypothetical protein
MFQELAALQDTPVPVVLIIIGAVFFTVGLGAEITFVRNVPKRRSIIFLGTGIIMFVLGIGLYVLPGSQNLVASEEPTEAATATREPTKIPTAIIQTTVPTEPEGTPRNSDTVVIRPISTPTRSPTSEVERTPTKTASVTPISAAETVTPTLPTSEGGDTPPGTVLEFGQIWQQGGMSMQVSDFRFTDTKCNLMGDWGEWKMTITADDIEEDFIVTDITQREFFLVDNEGIEARVYITQGDDCPGWFEAPDLSDLRRLAKGETHSYRVYGLGSLQDRQWFEFGIRKGGRIEDARWRIDIPR